MRSSVKILGAAGAAGGLLLGYAMLRPAPEMKRGPAGHSQKVEAAAGETREKAGVVLDADPAFNREVIAAADSAASEILAWVKDILEKENERLIGGGMRGNVARRAYRLHTLLTHLRPHLHEQTPRETMQEIKRITDTIRGLSSLRPSGIEPFVTMTAPEEALESLCEKVTGSKPQYTYDLPAQGDTPENQP